MTTNLKWLRLAAMIAVLAMLAAACGSDDGGGAAEEATDGAAEVAEPTEEPATDAETEPVEETEAPTETSSAAPIEGGAASDALSMAYLLPETGTLAFLGPPIIGGFDLAIQEINEAGGVNGAEVVASGGDEGEDAQTALNTVNRLIADGAHIIIGAAASGQSLNVLDTVTGSGVAMCSPSNTSPTFTNIEDGGLYFRAAPTDALQGPVLGEQLVAAGATNVALLARADDYGQGLLNATAAALEEAGATVAVETTYDPNAQSFDAEVQQIVDSGADAVALIAFDEGGRILQTMIERGVGPADLIVFGADGTASSEFAAGVDPNNPGVLEGMRTTSPASVEDEEFDARLAEVAGELDTNLFAAQGYDCTVAAALAAQAAGENSSQAIADNMIAVTGEGTKCTSYAECLELLEAGEDIDFDGVSGPLDFTDAGEPSQGTYDLREFTAEGELELIETIDSSL